MRLAEGAPYGVQCAQDEHEPDHESKEDGTVEEVRIVTGNLVLTKSAVEAVKRWRFKPFEADGKPSKAFVSLSFEFGAR